MLGYIHDRKADALFVLGIATFLLALTLKDAPLPVLHVVAGFCLGMSIPLQLGSLWQRRKISGKPRRR